MTRRVFGIETEYGITCAPTRPGPPPLDADHAARHLFTRVIEHERSTNVFLENGGRLYLDVGSHPEYATAECSTLTEIISQDAAGSAILADLAVHANRQLSSRDVPGRIHLFKNNVDTSGNSCGCHENYMIRREAEFRRFADGLVSYFVARQVLVGAGWCKRDGTYAFSQRADYIDDVISAATTRTRPIINTRDEPLAEASRYRRLHVVVGDSSISQGTTLLKIGMTRRLLSALETGLDISDLAFAHPLDVLRAASADLDAAATYEMADGRRLRVTDVLEEFGARLRRGEAEDDPLDDAMWDLWERGIEAVRTRRWSLVDTELDWAIKDRLLRESEARAGRELDPLMRTRLELAYHDITEGGLAPALTSAGRIRTFVTPEDVAAAVSTPPGTTRAVLRGTVITAAKRARRDLSADWLHLRLNDSTQPTLTLSDPLATDGGLIAALLAELESPRA